jgi:hypothetical protein
MVTLAEVMKQSSTVKSAKSPDHSPFCTVQEGVGVNVDVGVNVTVGVADGANVGVMVGVDVKVGVGVIVGPNTCPGPQADRTKLMTKTRIAIVCCFVFIFLLRYHGRTRRLKVSRILMQYQRTIFWFHTCATVN